MDLGLSDRTALVTGATSGIGRATALAFAAAGADVAVTYHSHCHAADDIAAEITSLGRRAVVAHYDLADDASIRVAIATVVETLGQIDVLVNNAVNWASRGGPAVDRLFEEIPTEEWRAMTRSTIEGAYLTTQLAVASMRQRGWGRIVTISSTLAEDGLPGAAAYSAGKAALHGVTRSLAWEVGPAGILANVVMPGVTLTERNLAGFPPTLREQVRSQTPTGRISSPEDVANTVVFLGSAANGNITGEIVRVSGGL